MIFFSYAQKIRTVLPPLEYQQKLEHCEGCCIIDVRTPFEYKTGYIAGARNISFIGFSFTKRASKLDRDKPVFIYCQTAHRSPFAAQKLYELGFRKIYDLKGGFRKWEEKGLPVAGK